MTDTPVIPAAVGQTRRDSYGNVLKVVSEEHAGRFGVAYPALDYKPCVLGAQVIEAHYPTVLWTSDAAGARS